MFLQVKKQMPIHPPTSWDGITSHRDHGYGKGCQIQFKKVPHLDIQDSHGKEAKQSTGQIKEKMCVPVRCNNGKMVWKMGCNTLASWCIHRFLYDEAFLQCQCIMTWEKCGDSHLTSYYICCTWLQNHVIHRVKLHTSLFDILTMASIRLSSH